MAKFFGFKTKRKNLSKKVPPLTAEGRKRQDEAILEKTKRWKANQLLYCAWAIEICAAGIGFFFAYITGEATRDYLEQDTFFGSADIDVLLAQLPFAIIGVVELTKIPLAFAAYNAKAGFWKALFIGALLSLCLITGETIFSGMERSLYNQLKYFAAEKTRQEEIIDGILIKAERINDLGEESTLEFIDAEYDADIRGYDTQYMDAIGELTSERETKLKELEVRETQLRDRYFGGSRQDEVGDLENQLKIVLDRINRKEVLLASEIKNSRDSTQKDLDSINEQISDHNKTIREARANVGEDTKGGFLQREDTKMQDQVDAATRLLNESKADKNAQQIKLEEKIKTFKEESKIEINIDIGIRNNLQKDLSSARSKSAEQYKTDQKLIDNDRDALINRIQFRQDTTQSEYEKQKELRGNNYRDARNRAENVVETLDELKSEKEELDAELIEVENTISNKAGEIQVMRFAASYASYVSEGQRNDVEDVVESDIALVMFIWFGSIALIAATTGTIIAFASFYIRDPRNWQERYLDDLKRVTPLQKFLRVRRKYFEKKMNGEIKPGFFTSISNALVRLIEAWIKRLKEPKRKETKIKYLTRDQYERTVGMKDKNDE